MSRLLASILLSTLSFYSMMGFALPLNIQINSYTAELETALPNHWDKALLLNGSETQKEIVTKHPFEVKTGAQYVADIKAYPVQGLNYHYVLKDHLGSPRVVFQDVNNNNSIDFASDLEDVKNYYPFGLEWEAPTHQEAKYRNAYNNKERISHTKYLDFGARNYIKSANVFDGPDPISSSFPELTTINYAGNRVPNGVDLHGLLGRKLGQSKRLLANRFVLTVLKDV